MNCIEFVLQTPEISSISITKTYRPMLGKSRRVRLLVLKPHLVRIQYLDTGQIADVSRKRFELHLDLGFFELVNPEAMPAAL